MFVEVDNRLINLEWVKRIEVLCNDDIQEYKVVFILTDNECYYQYFNNKESVLNYYSCLAHNIVIKEG